MDRRLQAAFDLAGFSPRVPAIIRVLSGRDFLRATAIASLSSVTGVPLFADEKSDVVFLKPADAAYAKARQIFNGRMKLNPAVVALCSTESGVQQALEHAKTNNLPVAIK